MVTMKRRTLTLRRRPSSPFYRGCVMRDEDKTREQVLEDLLTLRALLARAEKRAPTERPGLSTERCP